MQIRSDYSRFSLFPIGLNKGTKPSCGSEHAAGVRPACTDRRCFLCLAGEHLGWVTEHPNITVPMQPVSISTQPLTLKKYLHDSDHWHRLLSVKDVQIFLQLYLDNASS